MAKQELSFLSDRGLRLLLFGGKGGVGKTTAATATALYQAELDPARTTLVVSTDPAHSLADSFDQPIGDEITPIAEVPNLFALEMDAARRLKVFDRQHGQVLKTIADRGTYFDQEDIASFFDLSLPGLDELMAVIEIAGIVRDGQYDLVILDTAPTGHTLRLLALPRLMEEWLRVLDLMLQKHRYMASVLGRYRPDETDAFLESLSGDLRRLRLLLSDGKTTEFIPVTIPEAMSIEETSRLLDALTRFPVRTRTMIVNRVMPPSECPFCAARREGQRGHLEEIERRFPAWEKLWVPLLPQEVRGKQALRRYARAMLGQSEQWPEPGPGAPPFTTPSVGQAQITSLGPQQLVLFGGKGGVGKTTMAAASAIHLARASQDGRTLLFSTDPAHSLSDSLSQEIGNRITPIAGVEGLFALEMEGTELLQELRQTYLSEIRQVFDAFLGGALDVPFDRRVMEELISLTPPGLDELMALIKIMEFMDEGRFDRYVLDLAPTGHALRFLELPHLVRQWMTAFFKLLLKYQGMVSLTRVAMLLREKSKQLRRVEQLLVDAERCQFVAVAIPEAMVVLETERLLQRLAGLSIASRWLVVNMVVPSTACAFCSAVQSGQQRHLETLAALAPHLIQVPLFAHEVRGVTELEKVARIVYGDGDGDG